MIVVNISDTHAGCKLGLCNPDVVLFDENEAGEIVPYHPKLTATQRYLWDEVYLPGIDAAVRMADGAPIVVIHNGDETHGTRYMQELVSTRMSDQVTIAAANFAPWLALPNLQRLVLVAGTGSHGFYERSAPLLIQGQLADGRVSVCTHALVTVDGVTIDVAHHGPHPGSREWLRGNVARYYLRDVMLRAIMAGQRPPRLVWRAHYHAPVHEVLDVGGYTSELYITPSMCGITEHGVQATRSAGGITWGFNIYEIEAGEVVKCLTHHKTKDLRTTMTL